MKNKAVFFDRDGVINVEKNYVYKIEDFKFIDGIFDTMRIFLDKGYLIIIITNQAGIGRGLYTEEDFILLNDWMLEQFQKESITITKVYYCPYHPEYGLGKYKRNSFDRKPNPGMLLRAAKQFNIDLNNSILIGDRDTDIQAGIAAGVGKNFLLNSEPQFDFQCFMNLQEIIRYLFNEGGTRC